MRKQQLLCVIGLLLAIGCVPRVVAVEPRTAHTFRLSADETHPQATLDHARWLVGSWSGTAFGKRFEEVWSPPSAGSMLGTFKLFNGNTPEFYEILLLTVEAGTLSLKVKHFSPDFTAWEDKSDYVEFRLVKMSEDELHFSGISFYRLDADHMEAYVVMRNGDELMEHKLVYERVSLY
jgi:hypothetical protein